MCKHDNRPLPALWETGVSNQIVISVFQFSDVQHLQEQTLHYPTVYHVVDLWTSFIAEPVTVIFLNYFVTILIKLLHVLWVVQTVYLIEV